MRVRPEVSELSSEGAIRLNGFEIPALTTRRAETTVELGSGQSFMIGGLLRNSGNNTIEHDALPRRPADPRRAVPLEQLPPQRDRAGHRRHALSGPAGQRQRRSRCRPTATARRRRRSASCSASEHDGRTGERRPVPGVGGAADGRAGRRRDRQRRSAPAPRRRRRSSRRSAPAALPPRQTAAAAQPGFNF